MDTEVHELSFSNDGTNYGHRAACKCGWKTLWGYAAEHAAQQLSEAHLAEAAIAADLADAIDRYREATDEHSGDDEHAAAWEVADTAEQYLALRDDQNDQLVAAFIVREDATAEWNFARGSEDDSLVVAYAMREHAIAEVERLSVERIRAWFRANAPKVRFLEVDWDSDGLGPIRATDSAGREIDLESMDPDGELLLLTTNIDHPDRVGFHCHNGNNGPFTLELAQALPISPCE